MVFVVIGTLFAHFNAISNTNNVYVVKIRTKKYYGTRYKGAK